MFCVKQLFLVLCMSTMVSYAQASSSKTDVCNFRSNKGIVILDSTKVRIENKDKCFGNEYTIIKEIRKKNSTIKTQHGSSLQQIVGLSLSGGGIKSSSFQLGLLSGLSRSRNRNGAPLLNEIDYIASVSGGSWANGAYMFALESDEVFFSGLRDVAAHGENRKHGDLYKLLPNKQDKIFGSKK